MKKNLMLLHRWLGFPLGIVFMITFGSGCLTAVDELWQRVEHHNYNAGYVWRATTPEENAIAVENMLKGKTAIRQILMPTPNNPYYRVVARGESWTYAIDHFNPALSSDVMAVVYNQTENQGVFRTILQLHRNFLLGKEGLLGIEGKYYVTWVGLIALLLSLVGLWLWWPRRKTFATKHIMPQGKKRKDFFTSHVTNGVVVLLAIFLLAVTGASITYRSFTKQLLNVKPEQQLAMAQLDDNWQSWIKAAYAAMPDGSQLQQIRMPRKSRKKNAPQLLDFRFYAQGNWLGLASSKVKINPNSSQLVTVTLFKDFTLAEKVYALLVPLHTGKHLPVLYVAILLIFSLLGTLMVFSGVVSFLLKKSIKTKIDRVFSVKRLVKNA